MSCGVLCDTYLKVNIDSFRQLMFFLFALLQVYSRSVNGNGSIDSNSNSLKEEAVGEVSNGHEKTFTGSTRNSNNEDITSETISAPPVVCVNLNKLDEKFKQLDEEFSASNNSDQARTAVKEEAISTNVASNAESAVEAEMNALSQQEDDRRCLTGTNGIAEEHKAVANQLRRQPTQEELIPFFLEERKKKEEERKKKRLIEEERLKEAREERRRLDEEHVKEVALRKAAFQEEREKLQRQMTNAVEEEQPPKMPLSRTEASKMVERELEEQRIRELQTQMELERIKEIEKRELDKKKSKQPIKNEEHPAAYKKRSSVIEKPIFDDDMEGAQAEKSSIEVESERREDEARRLAERKKREAERARQQTESQVVLRRPKDRNAGAEEKARNRKSIIELEIERQRAREEDLRLESEKRQQEAQRFKEASLAMQSKTSNAVSAGSVERTDSRNAELETQKERERQEAKLKEQEARRIKELVRNQSQGEFVEASARVESLRAPPASEDEIDAGLRLEGARIFEEEERRLEEEREKKRREELEKVHREALKREADVLLREKRIKEEELHRKRQADLLEAEKREREKKEAEERQYKEAESRRASFHAHKIILEQRVLKALQEGSDQTGAVRRRAPEDHSVTLREKSGSFSEEQRKAKRFSLNFDDASDPSLSQPEVRLRNKSEKKLGMRDRSTFYADEVVAREIQVRIEGEEGRHAETQSLKISERRKQFEKKDVTPTPSPVEKGRVVSSSRERRDAEKPQRRLRKVSSGDVVDAGEVSVSAIADDRIRRELEEQRRKEEMLRKEAERREQERRKNLEEERRKATSPVPPGQKVACVDEIKKTPLSNPKQVC